VTLFGDAVLRSLKSTRREEGKVKATHTYTHTLHTHTTSTDTLIMFNQSSVIGILKKGALPAHRPSSPNRPKRAQIPPSLRHHSASTSASAPECFLWEHSGTLPQHHPFHCQHDTQPNSPPSTLLSSSPSFSCASSSLFFEEGGECQCSVGGEFLPHVGIGSPQGSRVH